MMKSSKFTFEQKEQLLTNLDIEVAHRTRQLESWLSDTLAAFRNRHERQLAYIPHLVLRDKYDGDIQAALRGLQKERLALDVAPVDRNAMKRKWASTLEEESENRSENSAGNTDNHIKASKNPRIAPPSPRKKPPPFLGSTSMSHIHPPKTPGTVSSLARQVRVPSTSTFKPSIPKTPAYPPRWPRKDESMLSINGSPLANPYELGLEWLTEGDAEAEDVPDRAVLRRTASNIVIRRDPSFVPASNSSDALNHQAVHSRSNSQSQHQPHSRSNLHPGGIAASNSGHMAARVAVPTRDGHLLEFDPLLTSPGALDKLEGITDSAKKQAKEDMSKLVKAAVAKWNIK
ncbi:hypothetical protein B0F90DRAFT_1809318 [Multifurca ochricompacta]|uniref:Borealin N-terminal domain-containing protein n=1 Tax=Multifurca ochricompacta TaxID=376703 RepID=A0AAD4M753_9AGAM|nr:hypothetical protein B0F90DRAFT_1809318 [Multifurca ochricompacta]